MKKVQAFAAQTSAEPLANRVRLRRPHRRAQNPHAHIGHRLVEFLREDAVPVVEHESVAMIVPECLAELLQGPVRGGMGGHIGVEDSPRANLYDHEHVQSAERDRDHGEEVAGHDCLGVIADERQPSLLTIWRPPRTRPAQVFPHRPRRHSDAELQLQFVGDPSLAPGRIGSGKVAITQRVESSARLGPVFRS